MIYKIGILLLGLIVMLLAFFVANFCFNKGIYLIGSVLTITGYRVYEISLTVLKD